MASSFVSECIWIHGLSLGQTTYGFSFNKCNGTLEELHLAEATLKVADFNFCLELCQFHQYTLLGLPALPLINALLVFTYTQFFLWNIPEWTEVLHKIYYIIVWMNQRGGGRIQ